MNAERDDCPTFDCDDELPGRTTVALAMDADAPDRVPPSDARCQALHALDQAWDDERRDHVASRRLAFPYRKSGVPNGLYLACDGAIHGVAIWLLGGRLIAFHARLSAVLWWAGLAVLAMLAGHFLNRAYRYATYQRAYRRYLRRREDLARWDGRAQTRPGWLAR